MFFFCCCFCILSSGEEASAVAWPILVRFLCMRLLWGFLGFVFLGFFQNSSEFQWEKARWKNRTELLEWQAEILVKYGQCCSPSSEWAGGIADHTGIFWCGREAELDSAESTGLIVRLKGVEWQLAGFQPWAGDCPWEHRSTPGQGREWAEESLTETVLQIFGLGFMLIHRISKMRFFWLRGGKQDTILGLLLLAWEGLQLWESLEIQLWCVTLVLAQASGAGTLSELQTVVISLEDLCIYYQSCCSKTDSLWVGI